MQRERGSDPVPDSMVERYLPGRAQDWVARTVLILLCVSAVVAIAEPVRAAEAATPDRPPSILLIITDDQRWDTLDVMRTVQGRLARRGITFTNGYTTNPSCCPSRASLLTGLYSHNTGVWSNKGPYGGFDDFDDTSTLATWLDDAGYRTGLFGKYLNGYSWRSRYVPPGWDTWFAKGGGYYDYRVVEAEDGDLSVTTYGDDPSDYSTRVLTRRTRAFLSSTPVETPFFAVLAYSAPHRPATPDVRDLDTFRDLRPYRPPSFDERDLSDKPSYITRLQPLTPSEERAVDAFRRDQLRALLSVDRGIDRLLSTLRSLGRLTDTMVVLTSDHGYQWGEHRWVGKGYPYEESIRVPLVVRYDPLVGDPGGHSSRLVLGIDLAPTVAEIAGIPIPPVDGASFASLLVDPRAAFRHAFIVEHRDNHTRHPTFCALRLRGRWSFVRYYVDEAVTEIELYDLRRDPYQLLNVARDRRYEDERTMLRAEANDRCVVPPA